MIYKKEVKHLMQCSNCKSKIEVIGQWLICNTCNIKIDIMTGIMITDKPFLPKLKTEPVDKTFKCISPCPICSTEQVQLPILDKNKSEQQIKLGQIGNRKFNI